MSARSRMTHRCATERDADTGAVNPYGQAVTALTMLLSDQPCYYQAQSSKFIADGEKVIALAQHLVLFPLETDVSEQDMIVSITDRRGRVLKGTRLRVVQGGIVSREDHIEARAEEAV